MNLCDVLPHTRIVLYTTTVASYHTQCPPIIKVNTQSGAVHRPNVSCSKYRQVRPTTVVSLSHQASTFVELS